MSDSWKSIFCLEGEWDDSFDEKASVVPLLDLLERLEVAKYVHRDVATRHELVYYLERFARLPADEYPILYLATHGLASEIQLGLDDISLRELGDLLEGKLAGRVLYFGSCLVGSTSAEELMELVRKTGARSVVAYKEAVDWLESASFDLLLLSRLTEVSRGDAIYNGMIERYESFAAALGLVVVTKKQVYSAG